MAAVAAGAAADAAYYQSIEDFFVSRRGDPLFLSNADWTLVHAWRREGVPLRVVLRGIADALEGHAHSWGRGRKVGSLRYCAAEVEAARERWLRALALDREEGTQLAAALAAMASALEAAVLALGADTGGLASQAAAEIRSRAAGRLRNLEPWLAERERALVAALSAEAGGEQLAELQAEVDATLTHYRERMPARVLEQVREEGITRRLLARYGLPRLSLVLL
jgi:hypothetical protein